MGTSVLSNGSVFVTGSNINKVVITEPFVVDEIFQVSISAIMSPGSIIKSGSTLRIAFKSLPENDDNIYFIVSKELLPFSNDVAKLVTAIVESKKKSETYSDEILDLKTQLLNKGNELSELQTRYQIQMGGLVMKNLNCDENSRSDENDKKTLTKIVCEEEKNINILTKTSKELTALKAKVELYERLLVPTNIIDYLTSKGASQEAAKELAMILLNDQIWVSSDSLNQVNELVDIINKDIEESSTMIKRIKNDNEFLNFDDVLSKISSKLTVEQQNMLSKKAKRNNPVQEIVEEILDEVQLDVSSPIIIDVGSSTTDNFKHILEKLTSVFVKPSDHLENQDLIHPDCAAELLNKIDKLEKENHFLSERKSDAKYDEKDLKDRYDCIIIGMMDEQKECLSKMKCEYESKMESICHELELERRERSVIEQKYQLLNVSPLTSIEFEKEHCENENKTISILEDKVKCLERDLKLFSRDETDNGLISKMQKSCEEKISEMEKQCKHEISELEKILSAVFREKNEADNKHTNDLEELQTIIQHLSLSEHEREKQYVDKITSLKLENKTLIEKLALNEELLRCEKNKWSSEINQSGSELDKIKSRFDEDIDCLNKKITSLKAKRQSLKDENIKLRADLDLLIERSDSIETVIDSLKHSSSQLKRLILSLDEFKCFVEIDKDPILTVCNIRSFINNLMNDVKLMCDQKQYFDNDIADYETKISEMMKIIECYSSELNQLNKVHTAGENSNESICQSELKFSKMREIELVNTISRKDEEIKRVREEIINNSDNTINFRNETFSRINSLENEKYELMTKISDLEKNVNGCKDLSQIVEDSEDKLKSLKLKIKTLSDANEVLTKDLENSNSLKVDLQREFDYLKCENKNLLDTLTGVEHELTIVKNDAIRMAKTIQENSQAITQNEMSVNYEKTNEILTKLKDLNIMPRFVIALDRVMYLGSKKLSVMEAMNVGSISEDVFVIQNNKISAELEQKKLEFIRVGIEIDELLNLL
jgi:hypothetical protein